MEGASPTRAGEAAQETPKQEEEAVVRDLAMVGETEADEAVVGSSRFEGLVAMDER